MSQNLSRRDFLKLAGATSAGLTLSACGVKATELPTATFVQPTATLTTTPTPTGTPEPSPTSKPHRLTFRDITERTGTYVCTTVSGDEDWQSPAYITAENELFSGIFIQNSFMRDVVNKWTDYTGKEFLKRAKSANQIPIIHPGFWWLNTLMNANNEVESNGRYVDPLWYATPEEVEIAMEQYSNYIMSCIRPNNNGQYPTIVHIANEIRDYDLDAGGSYNEWADSPYNRGILAQGKNPIVESYMKFYNAAVKRGFTVGKHVRLSISDYNLVNLGGKTRFIHDLYLEAKREIAEQLRIEEKDVQFDVSLECHEYVTNRPYYHRPYPSQEELEQVIDLWNEDFSGVHLTEINAVGTISQDVSNNTLAKYLCAGVKKRCLSTSIWNSQRVNNPEYFGTDPSYHDHKLFDDRHQPTENYYMIVENVANSI